MKKYKILSAIIAFLIFIVGIFLFIKPKNLTIKVDGTVIKHKSTGSIRKVIDELDIELGKDDKINYNIDSKVKNNQSIVISRVYSKEEEVIESIEFKEEVVKDYKLEVGKSKVVSNGVNGEMKKTYLVTYEDGKEINRVLKDEEVIKEATNKVIAEGIFDASSMTVCVNQKRRLSSSYEPSDLVLPKVRGMNSSSFLYMRKEAAKALEDLFNEAEKDNVYLYAVSGYRSYKKQKSIYNPYSGYSAPPGASEHQLGLAMDLTLGRYGSALYVEFGQTKEGKWVEENAHKYGFVIRYLKGKEDITGYKYEPWHIRYLGVELATELYEKGITLEEYYGEY